MKDVGWAELKIGLGIEFSWKPGAWMHKAQRYFWYSKF
jgi:hypothetical protein